MKDDLTDGITLTVIGVVMYGLFELEFAENRKQAALCEVARQYMEDLDAGARASTTGLFVNAYVEHKEAASLTSMEVAIGTNGSISRASIEGAIPHYVERFSDAGINIQLTPSAQEQRIPDDSEQEIKRAEKALSAACNRY